MILATAVRAQQPPMMMDPSRMSGIPRPDPKIPPLTLTVRVLRGDFAHPAIGEEVILTGADGNIVQKQKVPEATRVTFSGLTAGATYVAKCTAFGTTLTSEPVTMEPAPGVAMMLVFPKDESQKVGEADGVARVDKELAKGTVEVRVVDGEGSAIAKVDVVLASGMRGSKDIKEQHAITDDAGVARFHDLDTSGQLAFAVKALKEGAKVASQPFQLSGEHGVVIGLRAVVAAEGLGKLHIADRSHFIIELKDDDVEVVENLMLENPTPAAIDTGSAGLRLPLADGATGAQVAGSEDGAPSPATIDGSDIVVRGAIAPGVTALRVGYFLPIVEEAVAIRLRTPIVFDNLLVITDKLEGVDVEGSHLEKTEKTMGQRTYFVVSGPGVPAGGTIDVRITGLPHASTIWRNLAAAIAALILGWGLVMSLRRPVNAVAGARGAAERRRQKLLEELGALDGKDDKPSQKKRGQLVSELEDVYRALDEA